MSGDGSLTFRDYRGYAIFKPHDQVLATGYTAYRYLVPGKGCWYLNTEGFWELGCTSGDPRDYEPCELPSDLPALSREHMLGPAA